MLNFTKMHGCGNDYIYFNCFNEKIENPGSLSEMISNRHFGIGGDGIVLICPSSFADAKMRMFNIDGSEGKMCGNAIRCVGKYLYDNNIVKKSRISIETLSGTKQLDLFFKNGLVDTVTVDMGTAVLKPSEIPVSLPLNRVIDEPIEVDGKTYKITCVSMGNPHCIVFVSDVYEVDILNTGPLFENHPLFPERVNTEFVHVVSRNLLEMRVYERGSGETLACGTGACASVVAAVLNGFCDKGDNIKVKLLGGELDICYDGEKVLMTGPATEVFKGCINL